MSYNRLGKNQKSVILLDTKKIIKKFTNLTCSSNTFLMLSNNFFYLRKKKPEKWLQIK